MLTYKHSKIRIDAAIAARALTKAPNKNHGSRLRFLCEYDFICSQALSQQNRLASLTLTLANLSPGKLCEAVPAPPPSRMLTC